jgi:hypothetical protein
LFVARIVAHDVHHPSAADDFAMIAQALDTSPNFHDPISSLTRRGKLSARTESLSVYGLARNLFKASECLFSPGFLDGFLEKIG